MKLQIKRAAFTQLMGKLHSIVPSKPAIPVLANILIEASKGQVILSVTDSIVSMRIFAEAQVSEEGSIAIPARRFFQLVRELTTPEIELKTPSPETLSVHAGSSHFRIQGMHKTEFPAFPEVAEGVTFELKNDQLKEMLMKTSFAAARDESRQVLTGVFLQKADNQVTLTATDGKRLAKNQIEIAPHSKGSGAGIVPLKAVEEMTKLLDDPSETAEITLMKDKLALEVGPVLLITKLLLGQYPDVSRVIPARSQTPLSLHREELMTLLKQVALFTSDESHPVRFSFSPGTLHLTAASGTIGEGNVSMPVNFAGTELDIGFNPHYFLDILRHSKDEIVHFDVTDAYNPGLITDSSHAEFLIMPMRLESLVEAK